MQKYRIIFARGEIISAYPVELTSLHAPENVEYKGHFIYATVDAETEEDARQKVTEMFSDRPD